MEIKHALESLRLIENAKVMADRNSQNNGTVPLVWGAGVFFLLSGFDVFPALTRRWYGLEDAGTYGPLLAANFLLPMVLGVALWTGRYLRRLPVTPLTPGNRWLFVKENSGGRMRFSSGWWIYYHVGVLFGGFGLGFWLAHSFHQHHLPACTYTVTGLVDAAPLLLTGWAQRRRVGRQEAEA